MCCVQIRAANLSGDCAWKRELLRGNTNIQKQHQVHIVGSVGLLGSIRTCRYAGNESDSEHGVGVWSVLILEFPSVDLEWLLMCGWLYADMCEEESANKRRFKSSLLNAPRDNSD